MKITIPYDPHWEPLFWAKEFCSSYITNTMHTGENSQPNIIMIDYCFADEQDAIWFALKWNRKC